MPIHVAGFIYSRSDSKRLPGKPFVEVGGSRMIDVIFSRAQRLNVQKIVLLTTDRSVDDRLADYCLSQGHEVFRGDAIDLVKRTLQGIQAFDVDGFVRINGDCPLLEPTLINAGLARLGKHAALVSNLFRRTFPYGVAVECVSSSLFKEFARLASESEREHVTNHLYRLKHRFTTVSIENATADHSGLRLTVDTAEDREQMELLSTRGCLQVDPYWKLWDLTPPVSTYTKRFSTHAA
jgi:spore coat polysaccharide biosynthesis protein SpsF